MTEDIKKDVAVDKSKDSTSAASKTDNAAIDSAIKVEDTSSNKGGEKTVAKDPTGMFDYSKCQTYTVKKDDSLFDVAQKYGVALQQLRYFNHLNKATWRIREGQTLYIPTEPIHVPTGK